MRPGYQWSNILPGDEVDVLMSVLNGGNRYRSDRDHGDGSGDGIGLGVGGSFHSGEVSDVAGLGAGSGEGSVKYVMGVG